MAAVNALAGAASGFVASRPCPTLARRPRCGHDNTTPSATTAPAGHPRCVHARLPQHGSRRLPGGLLTRALPERRGRQRNDSGAAEALGEARSAGGSASHHRPEGSARRRPARHACAALRGRGAARCGRVPVRVLRVGIYVGDGGISREPMRQLVEHVPLWSHRSGSEPAPSPSPSTAPHATQPGADLAGSLARVPGIGRAQCCSGS